MPANGSQLGQDLARLKLSYRELYQHAPVMYFSINSEGQTRHFQRHAGAHARLRTEELQNQNYPRCCWRRRPAKNYVDHRREHAVAGRGTRNAVAQKDGTHDRRLAAHRPVYDEDGHFVRCRSAALDLTEKNRLANELRSRGDELERTNQRLRAINSELEEFTHVVSHDLKEPLRTLQAYSNFLAEEHAAQLGPDGFQYINHLVRASRRLGRADR